MRIVIASSKIAKMFKAVLALFAVLLVVARGNPLQSTTTVEYQVIQLEEPCVRQGGICLRIEDCEPASLVQMRGVLCPAQRHLGVECCYM